jgi:ketosteroid isomerase-like protein
MSQENVELVRAGVDAFNRRDLDGFVASLSPDVVWEENPQLPGLREIYRGRAQVREWIDEILEAVETIHNEIVEITELRDDRVFTENVVTGRGTGSGVPVELRYWSIGWIAEGKVTRRQVFWNEDEALEAAGLQG